MIPHWDMWWSPSKGAVPPFAVESRPLPQDFGVFCSYDGYLNVALTQDISEPIKSIAKASGSPQVAVTRSLLFAALYGRRPLDDFMQFLREQERKEFARKEHAV